MSNQHPIPARRNMSAPPLPPISTESADQEPEAERIFTPPASYAKRAATAHLTYHGVAVDLYLADATVEQIERLIDGILRRDGWDAPGALVSISPPATTNGKPTAKRGAVEPAYDDEGTPLCPVHRKPLKDGLYGLYCSAKARDGEAANAKGYCAIKFLDA